MLACKQMSGYWHLVYLNSRNRTPQRSAATQQGNKMSKTASLSVASSATLFGRFMGTIDRLLMASARIAIRNGEPPYFGL
jgi:hypothetical protein